jgi:hypothetical protein
MKFKADVLVEFRKDRTLVEKARTRLNEIFWETGCFEDENVWIRCIFSCFSGEKE